MLLLYAVAFMGEVLTIVRPCVRPVVPFLFTRADQPFRRTGLPPPSRGFSPRAVILVVLLAAWGSACGLPRDPEGTLQRVEGGTMRVGITERAPWTSLANGEPAGIEPRLIRQFAAELDTEIRWVRGSESELLEALEHFELDLVIGGLTRSSPWVERVAFTRPFHTTENRSDGRGEVEHAIALPPGENGWLTRWERFLEARDPTIERARTGDR